MTEDTLRGCRVLVVEDEYLLADELQRELQQAGAVVIGPVGRLAAALQLARSEAVIDLALLDVNLGGETVFPAADHLAARGIPIVFTTGYDASSIPAGYANVATCEKPYAISSIIGTLGSLMAQRKDPPA